MHSTNNPVALREVIRYYRRVRRINAAKNTPQADWRSKDDLARLASREAELVDKLFQLTGNTDVSTPECWC